MLTAFDLVNLSTKVGAITNKIHIRRVTIAKKTETAERLKRRYGIDSDAHLREVVVIIARKLHIDDYQVIENLICETLRWLKGDMSERLVGVDTVAVNQPLYEFVDGVLFKVGRRTREAIDMDELKRRYRGEEYNPENKWWMPTWCPENDDDLVLTKKAKKLKEYHDKN